jgi:manganese oxidase
VFCIIGETLVNIRSNFIIVFSLIVSLASTGAFTVSYSLTNAIAETSLVSVEEYDKMKNCTKDLSRKVSSIEYLTYYNCGHVSDANINQTVREFSLIVDEKQKIPISYEGHVHEGWTFNGTIPGPTIRVTEGDLVRIKVINSPENQHAHSFHTHSIHSAQVDGVSMGGYLGGAIAPGNSFVYEFVANPYGVYPYHCHVEPIADHINRGLYGMLIIDPQEPREQMTEFAMLMNGYDLNYEQEGPTTIAPIGQQVNNEDQDEISSKDKAKDRGTDVSLTKVGHQIKEHEHSDVGDKVNDVDKEGNEGDKGEVEDERDNEIYTVNGKAFDYIMNPITLQTGKPYRVYLVNMLEFDLINSFHMHGTMYDYYTAGTDETSDFKTDIVTLAQGDRGIIEFQYDYPGKYMFHAHVTEFTDLGWMGFFDVRTRPPVM